MIGDRLIIQDKHLRSAKKIIKRVEDKNIVLIYGTSGTGKTETADCLQELLFNKGMQSIVLSLDDFYTVHHKVRNYNRKKQGLDSVGLKEIDWEHLRRICQDFQRGKPLHTRRYHKYSDVVEHNIIESDEINVLIFEGLYAGYMRKFDVGNVSVFLEGSPAQTLAFRKERRKEDENDDFRKQIVDKEHRIICQLKRYADLVVPFNDKKKEEKK